MNCEICLAGRKTVSDLDGCRELSSELKEGYSISIHICMTCGQTWEVTTDSSFHVPQTSVSRGEVMDLSKLPDDLFNDPWDNMH